MPAPKHKKIIVLFESGESFSLTDSQYKRKTGMNNFKNNTYSVKSS